MEKDVLREHFADLYRALSTSEPSRRSVTLELYAKKMISYDERNGILQLEASHNANAAATEILNRIETFVRFHPTDFNKVLKILKQEEVLATIVMSMENRLSPPQPGAPAMTPSAMTPSVAAPQSLVPTEHGGPRGSPVQQQL